MKTKEVTYAQAGTKAPGGVVAASDHESDAPARQARPVAPGNVPSLLVQVHDRYGLLAERETADFTDAIAKLLLADKGYPGAHVAIVRPSEADIGCADGLTDEERDAIAFARAGAS